MKLFKLMRCARKTDLHTTYYAAKDNRFKRVSRSEYYELWDMATRAQSLTTVSDETHWRHYATVVYGDN